MIMVFVAAGFLLGMGYFASLRHGVRVATAQRTWVWYVPSAILRLVAAALCFTLVARWGAASLTAAFAGFLAARHLALRTVRRLA